MGVGKKDWREGKEGFKRERAVGGARSWSLGASPRARPRRPGSVPRRPKRVPLPFPPPGKRAAARSCAPPPAPYLRFLQTSTGESERGRHDTPCCCGRLFFVWGLGVGPLMASHRGLHYQTAPSSFVSRLPTVSVRAHLTVRDLVRPTISDEGGCVSVSAPLSYARPARPAQRGSTNRVSSCALLDRTSR